MKILFAVNNDNVSEAIVKKYQKEYKEILSYKNVYYFNAIYRELQKDKSYSRIVISEDLEPFANNNYNSIDKFLFEKYSKICEEIKNSTNGSIDIILICADRRKKTDDMLVKLYKNEIYNAIIGQDRSIDEVCRLINQPRDKEEAKRYYNIHESELGENDSENSVSEAEVENIRAHYARLGKNEDKYVESFNNIVAQYTDTQLKIIIKYLPMNVKAVLEERSPKYQQLVTTSALNDFDSRKTTDLYKEKIKNLDKDDEYGIVEQLIKPKNIRNVVIPENITTKNVQKIVVPKVEAPDIETNNIIIENEIQKKNDTPNTLNETIEKTIEILENDNLEEQPKRGRGRPRKNIQPEEEKQKRGRGRPKKQVVEEITTQPESKKDEQDEIDLFNMDTTKQEKDKEVDLFDLDDNQHTNENNEVDLFNMNEEKDNENNEVDLFNIDEKEEKKDEGIDLFNVSEENESNTYSEPERKVQKETIIQNYNVREENTNSNYLARANNTSSEFNTILTADKKIVAFVGTTKNGTSFIVNNTAELLASIGIETAILDMTKTKNAYYIYTDDKENLRQIARNCMQNLQNGIAQGIKTKKHLTVYTEMPGEEAEYNIEKILTTLAQNYSAILIDTDFNTNPEIFEKVQEIYLVQTMDVLTIQPLTAFLRNLKSKEILRPEKLKIVINKSEKVRSLSIRTLIGGMSCYNSPSMTYMTELFNKDEIKYCEIPFEVQNYVKYLDSLVNCSISLNGYTKQFMMALRELANMVYPLISKQHYDSKTTMRADPFSNKINNTLNKMKEKY